MNFQASSVWLYEMAFLATAVAVIVGLTSTLERWVASAERRRNLWQACTVTLIVFTLLEVSGIGDRFGALVRGSFERRIATPIPKQTAKVSGERTQMLPPFIATHSAEPQFVAPAPARPAAQPAVERAMLWFFYIWAVGFLALALRFALRRLIFFWFSFRGRAIEDQALLGNVSHLAQQLAIRRPVRVIEFSRLQAPIAFGIFRPAI